MARNTRRSHGMKKIEPAVQTFNFVSNPTAAGSSVSFIDLSQCASLLNRRFYRQGITWAVAGIKIIGINTGNVAVSKLPETWVMSNSWEKGFRSWQKMNNEALEEAESVKPKFLDFKIYASAEHHTAGFGANLLPIADGGAVATPGEWESSKFRIPVGPTAPGDTTDREVIAVGGSFPGAGASGLNAVSLIEGYAASRGLPNVLDPNAPADADDTVGTTPENWMAALFNEGTEQTQAVLQDMITENNIAPYPFENDGVNVDTMYPFGANQLSGLQIHDIDQITATTIGGITHIKGGTFPCGLIKLAFSNVPGEGVTYAIQVDLVPGDHRGYLCAPMTDM